MRVLGIDPGIAITGCAVVSEEKGNLKLLESRAITTASEKTLSLRLLHLYNELLKVIDSATPQVIILENLFFNTNAKTAMQVGQARGIVQLAAAQKNINVVEYTPLQVKMALTGYGRAEKVQIQQMVKKILKLPQVITPDDVADAAAIALTYCFSYKINLKTQMSNVKSTS